MADEEPESGWEVAHLLTTGSAHFAAYEDLTEAELRALRKERREALKRKRPAGFAPWPDESP